MKILLFYPTHYCTGMKPIGLSNLKSYLQKHGHEVRIFDFAQYAIEEQIDTASETTKIGIFKPVPESQQYLLQQKKVQKDELLKIVLAALGSFRPDLLGVSLMTNNLVVANEYFSFIKKTMQLPIIVGGIHPTVAPERTINLPWVDMVCIGYGEKPLLNLLNSKLKNRSIANIWFKEDAGVIKNPILHTDIDFDNYEFPNWDDYSDIQFYKPFQGRVMRYGDVEFGRGCPYSCTFCVITYLRKHLNIKRYPKKRNERMIEELVYLKKRYNIEIFRFWDELFLLVCDEQLQEFAALYKKHVGLPFIIETTAESLNEQRVKILKEAGCVSISIGIESGNVELRNKILNKKTSNITYIEKFHIINDYGINTTGYNMIGLPEETENMILETIELNRKCQVKTPSPALFYPYPGTYLRDYCIEKGYLDTNFDDNVEESILYRRSVLKQDHIIESYKLKYYLDYFSLYCKVPTAMYSEIAHYALTGKINDDTRLKITGFVQRNF